jgi:hypothetical protein
MAGPRKTAADVAEDQIEDIEPSAPAEPISRPLSVGLGILQGVFGEEARKIVRVGRQNDPLLTNADPRAMSVEEFRARERTGQQRSDQVFDRAEAERPREAQFGMAVGIVGAPGPKANKARKVAGKVVGKVGELVRNKLAKRATNLAEAAAPDVVRVMSNEGKRAAEVVRVMSADGQRAVTVGTVEKIKDGVATVFAGGKRFEVPAERLQAVAARPAAKAVAP